MLIASVSLSKLSWMDWLNIIAFLLTIVGLGATWKQARDAKTASEQTKIAMSEAQNQVRSNQLLILIPQLRWTASELDIAIKDDDPELALRQLEHWMWQVGHIRGIVDSLEGEHGAVKTKLQKSVTLASRAGGALMGDGIFVKDACMKARSAIGDACNALIPMVGSRSTQVSREVES
ncbi:hypothetical protein [Actinomadura rayongensis]|uniref:Uncharacterized protein n=1 Tax=Actinomadura rayongensis TaxID=1429076 RepID=A0A6I4WMQ2_9ACTN|nr:hypothetical protein [Actinomadura rayongensis]MXQ68214.1 hypothetical protein [Actinomadura rayongensis]